MIKLKARIMRDASCFLGENIRGREGNAMAGKDMNIIEDKSEKERWAVRKDEEGDAQKDFSSALSSPSLFSIPVAVIFFFLLLLRQKQDRTYTTREGS